MASIIYTIHMGVCRLAALMALGDDLIRYFFAQPLVKYKILPVKFIGEFFFVDLVYIINNTTFQVKYICKTVMQHVR